MPSAISNFTTPSSKINFKVLGFLLVLCCAALFIAGCTTIQDRAQEIAETEGPALEDMSDNTLERIDDALEETTTPAVRRALERARRKVEAAKRDIQEVTDAAEVVAEGGEISVDEAKAKKKQLDEARKDLDDVNKDLNDKKSRSNGRATSFTTAAATASYSSGPSNLVELVERRVNDILQAHARGVLPVILTADDIEDLYEEIEVTKSLCNFYPAECQI